MISTKTCELVAHFEPPPPANANRASHEHSETLTVRLGNGSSADGTELSPSLSPRIPPHYAKQPWPERPRRGRKVLRSQGARGGGFGVNELDSDHSEIAETPQQQTLNRLCPPCIREKRKDALVNFLTPRRFPDESRPFLVEPPPRFVAVRIWVWRPGVSAPSS